MTSELLCVDDVTVRFGGLVALDNVSIHVARGSIHAVIGPNGAGKSTLLNVITGLYEATEGRVAFAGETDRRACAARYYAAWHSADLSEYRAVRRNERDRECHGWARSLSRR